MAFRQRFGAISCSMPTKTSRSDRLARPHSPGLKKSARTTAGATSPPVTVRATKSSKARSCVFDKTTGGLRTACFRSTSLPARAAPSHLIRHSREGGNPRRLQRRMDSGSTLRFARNDGAGWRVVTAEKAEKGDKSIFPKAAIQVHLPCRYIC